MYYKPSEYDENVHNGNGYFNVAIGGVGVFNSDESIWADVVGD